MEPTNRLLTIFNQIDDPRRDLGKAHQLNDILLISIIAVLCGADSWNQIEHYGLEKQDFLMPRASPRKTFLDLEHGILQRSPSDLRMTLSTG